MNFFLTIMEKILFVILLMGAGVFVKKMKWVSDAGERDLSTLMIDFVWPAMIFSSVTKSLSASDILTNIWLPILSVVVHLVGFGIGFVICRMAGFTGDRKKVFLFHATMNNFFVMALPFAQFFFPVKGAALLAVANLGSIIVLWSLGAMVVSGGLGLHDTLRGIFSPGMIATIAAVFCVLTGLSRYIPPLVTDALTIIGQPTLLFGLLIAGTQIYKLGWKALKFDRWNILVGLTRNILVPAVITGLAVFLRGSVSREALIITVLVGLTPASVNSVTLAMKYKTSPHLASEGVVFTHVLGIFSMMGFLLLVVKFFSQPEGEEG